MNNNILIDIPGYVGLYKACSSGRIWSGRKGMYLSSMLNKGYLGVTLYADGGRRTFSIHSLIALAFIGARPEGLVINHLDGDKLNNHPDNLAYTTNTDNIRHAKEMMLFKQEGIYNPRYRHGNYRDREYINRMARANYLKRKYQTTLDSC